MNTRLTGLLVLVMAAVLPRTAAADIIAAPDCLAMSAQARNLSSATIEVTAHVAWMCKPELLKDGFAKMSINDAPIAAVSSFDGTTPLVIKANTSAKLPMKVCVSVEGHGDSTASAVMAQECVSLGFTSVPLPQPRLGEMSVVPRF